MPIRSDKRILCSCREAAEELGCTMSRVRQMTRPGPKGDKPLLWSHKLGPRAMVLDMTEVKRLAAARTKAREAGTIAGVPPGGFRPV